MEISCAATMWIHERGVCEGFWGLGCGQYRQTQAQIAAAGNWASGSAKVQRLLSVHLQLC